MAQPQKFIKMSSGRMVEENIESINATTGAPDAAKLVRTASDGKLDPSLMPTGLGADVMTITASENLAAGDFVNIWNDTGTAKARKADASSSGKEADGFVLDAVNSGQSASVYFEGRNTALSGLTIGARYYLSAAAAGTVTTTPPSGTSQVVQFIGRASSATSLAFEATDGVILA